MKKDKWNDYCWATFATPPRLTGMLWAKFKSLRADFDEIYLFLDCLKRAWIEQDFSSPAGFVFWQMFDEQDYKMVLEMLKKMDDIKKKGELNDEKEND